MKFDPGHDIVVARTANDELWYNIHGTHHWTQVPAPKTKFTPAIAMYGGMVELVLTGLDNRVYNGQMHPGSKQWTAFTEIPGGGQLKAGPAAVTGSDGSFTVFGPGLDNRIYYHQWEDGRWEPWGWAAIPGQVRSADQVSAVEYQKTIIVAHRGLDERVWLAESKPLLYDHPGSAYWGANANVHLPPGNGTTRTSPALTLGENKDVLHVIVNGYNHDGFWYQSWRNGSGYLPGWKQLGLGYGTANAPAVNGTGFVGYEIDNGLVRTKYISGNCYKHPGPDDLCTGGSSHPVPVPVPPPTTPPPTTPPPSKPELNWADTVTYNATTRQIEMTIRNTGTLNAGPFRVSAMIGFSEVDQWLHNGVAKGSTVLQTVATQTLAPGTYNFQMVVDSYFAVDEMVEGNNTKPLGFTKHANGTVTFH